MGNILAFRALSWAVAEGYSEEITKDCEKALGPLAPVGQGEDTYALARARLADAAGYMNAINGTLAEAATYFAASRAAYERIDTYRDEYAMVLNNSAYVCAQLGQFDLARVLGHYAVEINLDHGDDYSMGLTFGTLAAIARMHENYGRAIEYGELALQRQDRVQDSHGIVIARIGLAEALRKAAQHDLRLGRELPRGRDNLERAERHLDESLKILDSAHLREEKRLATYVEQAACTVRWDAFGSDGRPRWSWTEL
jgi:tetratricopeptide (TPR) repeat protein